MSGIQKNRVKVFVTAINKYLGLLKGSLIDTYDRLPPQSFEYYMGAPGIKSKDILNLSIL